MAQGRMKVKSSLPSGAKAKGGQRHKKAGPKRGARTIAPKKTKLIEAARLKKTLEKAIKNDIEKEVSLKAASTEPKQFHVLKSTASTSKSSKTNKK